MAKLHQAHKALHTSTFLGVSARFPTAKLTCREIPPPPANHQGLVPPPPPPVKEGKDKRERIIVVVRRPCQENYPADAPPSAHKSVLESANPAWTRSVHLDAPGQRHGQQLVSGTADPGVVKQDKSSGGSVDTTKTRLDPQRVRGDATG